MKLVMVSVYDSAAQAFGRPIFVPSAGVAVRMFSDEVNRAERDNPLHNHPGDYALYVLGEFDDSDGSFAPSKPPERLMLGVNCIANPETRNVSQ